MGLYATTANVLSNAYMKYKLASLVPIDVHIVHECLILCTATYQVHA